MSENPIEDLAVPEVAICISTFRRPDGLRRLLQSLQTLNFEQIGNVMVRIIVVDNDADGTARHIIEEDGPCSRWPILYDVEPRAGVVYPRNRAVALAEGCDYIAFIDDDERAAPPWLDMLLWAQRQHNADVVVGPALPYFEFSPPAWILQSRFFEPPERQQTGSVPNYLDTGNLLIRKRVLKQVPGPFDPRFSLTGGEDTALHIQLHGLGARLVWCDEAIVRAVVSPKRMKVDWMLRRAYQQGNVATWCEKLHLHENHLTNNSLARGSARLLVGLAGLLPALLRGRGAAVRQLCMVARGLGRITGACGWVVKGYQHSPRSPSLRQAR